MGITNSRKKRLTVHVSLSLLTVFGLGFAYIRSGGLVATKKPSSLEALVAKTLLAASIPSSAGSEKNPLEITQTNLEAGRTLYQQKCASCHGVDGNGRTAMSGLYPPAARLDSAEIQAMKDGELRYFIRYGIRNTGMPGFHFTDEQSWQVVAYLRRLPKGAPSEAAYQDVTGAHYVGSAACKSCHAEIYGRWEKTLMANVVRDPLVHSDAIIPDLTKPDPLLTFTKQDISFVYGTKWKQRFFKKIGNDYYPLPAQWDITHKKWKPYFVKEDWWASRYPPDNFKRPTGPLCDGCHSTNYDVVTRTVTEWNVGCEKCHGPGSEHVKHAVSTDIINPAHLEFVGANDSCIQCHSQGRPLKNPANGETYDWPVGFHMGKNLKDFWKLESHRLGETTFTHFSDGTAHKNRMQGNDFVQSLMYTHGVTCFTCHDPHGTGIEGMLRKTADALCLDCHGPGSQNGPFAATLEAHTHHKENSRGGSCVECHMPKIAQTLGDVNVRSHTFRFLFPEKAKSMGIPNACNVCHSDKSVEWSIQAIKSWPNASPWRTSDGSAPGVGKTPLLNQLSLSGIEHPKKLPTGPSHSIKQLNLSRNPTRVDYADLLQKMYALLL